MTKRLLILDGPGLSEPARTDNLDALCRDAGAEVDYRQTDEADELCSWIRAATDYDGLIVNPVASGEGRGFEQADYRAALEALQSQKETVPAVELRLDNVFLEGNTGPGPAAIPGLKLGFVSGLGAEGYALAARYLSGDRLAPPEKPGSIRHISVLNGPNLNLLGTREPDIYGRDTLDDIATRCRTIAAPPATLHFRQSNHEGQLVDWIQEAIGTSDAIVINAAAYTHTSVAIHDALNAYPGKKFELHISNPHVRETFRHHSYVSTSVDGVVVGLGSAGYDLLVHCLMRKSDQAGG